MWTDELEKEKDGTIIWKPTSTSEGIKYAPGAAEAYRMWSPSPSRSGDPESPMMSALEVAEELLILTKGVRSTAVSRMLNGLLKVPAGVVLRAC